MSDLEKPPQNSDNADDDAISLDLPDESDVGIGIELPVAGEGETSVQAGATHIEKSKEGAEKTPRTTPQLEALGLTLNSPEVKAMQETFKATLQEAEGKQGQERFEYTLHAVKQLAHMKRLGLRLKNNETWSMLYGFANEIKGNSLPDKLSYLTYLKASDEELFAQKVKPAGIEKLRQEAQETILAQPDLLPAFYLAKGCMELKYLGVQEKFDAPVFNHLIAEALIYADVFQRGEEVSSNQYIRYAAILCYLDIRSKVESENQLIKVSARQVALKGLKQMQAKKEWAGFARLGIMFTKFFDGKVPTDTVKDQLVNHIPADREIVDRDYITLRMIDDNEVASYCADVASLLTAKEKEPVVILESEKTEKVIEPATPSAPEAAPEKISEPENPLKTFSMTTDSVPMPETEPAALTKEQRDEAMKKELQKLKQEERFIEKVMNGDVLVDQEIIEAAKQATPLPDAQAERCRQNFFDSLDSQLRYVSIQQEKQELWDKGNILKYWWRTVTTVNHAAEAFTATRTAVGTKPAVVSAVARSVRWMESTIVLAPIGLLYDAGGWLLNKAIVQRLPKSIQQSLFENPDRALDRTRMNALLSLHQILPSITKRLQRQQLEYIVNYMTRRIS